MRSNRDLNDDPYYLINSEESAIHTNSPQKRTPHMKIKRIVLFMVCVACSTRLTLIVAVPMDGTKLLLFQILKRLQGLCSSKQLFNHVLTEISDMSRKSVSGGQNGPYGVQSCLKAINIC